MFNSAIELQTNDGMLKYSTNFYSLIYKKTYLQEFIMGFFSRLKAEFIDIIEWEHENPGVLVHRFDRFNNEIKMNAKLIVRPGQRAVFVNEGEIADVFEPGTHTLSTQNMPILATLKGWKYGFESPFKAEVYFIKTTEQLDRKWGTPNPVMMRDSDFGVVRLRARGNYAYKIEISHEMISRFVGSRDELTADDIEGQVKTRVISSFSDCIGELKIPALDLAAQYDEIGEATSGKLDAIFGELGLSLLSFTIENITLPEEVEKAMDQRASMGAIGNMNQFAQYQSAQAVREMASNPNSGGGNMMGMMMGAQMAGGVGNALVQEQPQQAAPQMACPKCSAANPAGAKFCSSCGQNMQPPQEACVKCNAGIAAGSKFCAECGSPQESKCNKCGVDLAPGSKFCPECGSAQ